MAKIDLHIHTNASHFWCPRLENVIKVCKKKGFGFISITDHNEVKNAFKGKKLWKKVIVGEEIDTKEGQIVGLFLNELIKPGKTLCETLDKIKEQGGMFFIPHPLDKRLSLREERVRTLKKPLIELNGRVPTKKLREIRALFSNSKFIANSDAHHLSQIGNAFTIVNAQDEEELRSTLKKGKLRILIKKYPLRKLTLWQERINQLKCIFINKIKK